VPESGDGVQTMKAGLLESANSGVLFLDEVGDMPIAMQVKLLRAIQEQEVIRVGGNRPVPIDVQIIAATHQDLKKAVSVGLFRQDLYFRLNVVTIRIPPLRERKKDLPLLVNFFLHRAAQRNGKKIDGFSDEAMKILLQYEYPGNVRELENHVEHAVAMSKENVIYISDLPSELSEIEVFSYTQPGAKIKPLKEIERDYIRWVLNKTGRNKVKASKLLGINRASLWRHLKKHEIEE
jgi:DNA-binding NtrC family response regulator